MVFSNPPGPRTQEMGEWVSVTVPTDGENRGGEALPQWTTFQRSTFLSGKNLNWCLGTTLRHLGRAAWVYSPVQWGQTGIHG